MISRKMLETNKTDTLERVRQILAVWKHNRELYPGWIVYPTGVERTDFKQRTDAWEKHVLGSFSELTITERLCALFELVWRKEILLEPISADFEIKAQEPLSLIDCVNRVVNNTQNLDEDWVYLEAAWTAVTLALVTDARFESNREIFKQRLETLGPFAIEHPHVANRMHQERCLWALHNMEFIILDDLLDQWEHLDIEPEWKLRKAALLAEVGRDSEAATLVRSVLDFLNKRSRVPLSIASASLESWALASTLSFRNRGTVFRKWEVLSQYRADAWTEIEQITRTIRGGEERKKPPSFDHVIGRSRSTTWSNAGYTRMIAAYRGVRLPEVAGLPPVTINPDGIPTSVSNHLLKTSAEGLTTFNPELSVKLAIRVAAYDGDETLGRVLSRVQIANMTHESLLRLGQMCIATITYTLPYVSSTDVSDYKSSISPVERLRVALEALSRLVSRLDPDMIHEALTVATDCYMSSEVVHNVLLGRPLQNLIHRVWSALPQEQRTNHVFELLELPIVGTVGYAQQSQSADPCGLVTKYDIAQVRSDENQESFSKVIANLISAIQTGAESRSRAISRLIPLVLSGTLLDAEQIDISEALWNDGDPVKRNPRNGGSLYDWVYLVMPEPKKGFAEGWFRSKWLTPRLTGDKADAMYASNMLSQVSMAVNGMKGLNETFELTPDEQHHIIDQIGQLIEMVSSGSGTRDLGFRSRIRDIGPLIVNVDSGSAVANHWSSKIELFLSQPKSQSSTMFGSLFEMRIALAFALIPGLIKAMPDSLEKVSRWITQGVTSQDENANSEAINALRTWVSAASNGDLPTVPSELVRQVGAIISSNRVSGLADALYFAESVFDQGSESNQNAISRFALIGLDHLAERLSYDREPPDGLDNVHTLRLLCVRLSAKLALHGFEDDSTVKNWLNIGETDPFPETRYALIVRD